MKKIKLIKTVIGEKLESYGFKYYGKEPNSWIFNRKHGNVEQFVCIYDSKYDAGLRVELYTSLDIGARSEIRDFYPMWEQEYNKFFWEYIDEQSFVRVLNEFTSIIINYGLEELEILSIPTREKVIRPTEEMQKRLYDNHEEYCSRFTETYNMKIENIYEVIKNLQALMKENQDKTYEEMQELLIGMAAFYGSAMCIQFSGTWSYDGDVCSVVFRFNNEEIECFPLQHIVFNWRDVKFEEGLKNTFDLLFS
ncbi:hypothetical protein [Anaerosporobacter sp.]|uniref:hypothetical protein n=1 Tax=Anaerosporobacter sp. TaxID=1872529 RepID=UPI00286F417F|nr:hypothetical protein [Anaerosporobacter sp.]